MHVVGVVNQHAIVADEVDVFGVDLKVVDSDWRATTWCNVGDLGDGLVGSVEVFALREFTRRDEGLAVFGPERVIGGGADGFGFAVDVQVEDVAGGVAECGGDDLAAIVGVGFDGGTRLDRRDECRAGGSEFGEVELNRLIHQCPVERFAALQTLIQHEPAGLREVEQVLGVLLQPIRGTEQSDGQ